jgi:hypothetical protein
MKELYHFIQWEPCIYNIFCRTIVLNQLDLPTDRFSESGIERQGDFDEFVFMGHGAFYYRS